MTHSKTDQKTTIGAVLVCTADWKQRAGRKTDTSYFVIIAILGKSIGDEVPSHSEKQRRFMQAAAHSPEFAKKVGIPMAVAQEYNQADKGKKLAAAMSKMDKKNG